jgi:DNA-binding transcriptional LysR family regulator
MIDKLEFLIALAQERHFGRAAELCGVSQPTFSAAIQQLERSLRVRLVDRGARFRGFTPEGERVLDWARRIVADSRAMRQDIAGLRQHLSGLLRIAVVPTALPLVVDLTAPFHRRYPAVRFTILSESSGRIREMLVNLEIDAGITYLDGEPLGRVEAVPLFRERYCLITTKESAPGDTISWADVGKQKLCLLTPDMQNRRIVDSLLGRHAHEAPPVIESNSILALLAHVRSGLWASILPEALTDLVGTGGPLRMVPIVDPVESHLIGLVVPLREKLTPLATALLAQARASVAR